MAFIADNIFDSGLSYAQTKGSRIDVCSQEPTSYAEATSTYTLGNKTGLTVGAPTNGDTNGRKVVVPAITDGSVTADGTATHWALTDGTGELLATGSLSASQGVTNGNTFTLGAIDITIADAS
ncbi:hypothetical protein [Roseovarius pacificus]|uniref:hypothetical protein n=1 Tax=Roseovarius pacificus TaxID=337701 RepID=UPI002A187502|nr:hypothetical protein [Roseovarius pacificus]